MLRKQLEEGWDNSYYQSPGAPAKGANYSKYARPLAYTSLARPVVNWGLAGSAKPRVQIKVSDHHERVIANKPGLKSPPVAGKMHWPLTIERKCHWNDIPIAEKVTHGDKPVARGPTSPPIVTPKIARSPVQAKRFLKNRRKKLRRARKSRSVSSTSYSTSSSLARNSGL